MSIDCFEHIGLIMIYCFIHANLFYSLLFILVNHSLLRGDECNIFEGLILHWRFICFTM